MINIVYDNTTAHVEDCTADVRMILYEGLKYHPDGYEHVYSYKSERWDGYNYLYNLSNDTFRRGLTNRVVDILSKYGHAVRTTDAGVDNEQVSNILKPGLLRPYSFQDEAVQAALDHTMGLIVSPTGTGKSSIIARMLSAIGRKAMVLVTDIVLLDQMQQSLQRLYDQEIGAVGDGEFNLQDITVSTIQSLASILKLKSKNKKGLDKYGKLVSHISTVGVIISDEAHLSDSDSFGKVLPVFNKTRRFYGLSATPYGWSERAEKKQNMELEQHFGTVIFDSRKSNFIELGLKVPLHVLSKTIEPINTEYNIHMKRGPGGRQVPDHGKNYKECLDAEILNNIRFQEMVATDTMSQVANGNSVFVHAIHSLNYGEALKGMLPGAVLVNGSTPRKERRAIYDAMRKKEQLILVSDVGGAGLDIPSLNTMVLASDVSDSRQLKGRVSRAAADKRCGSVVDYHIETQFLKKHFSNRESQYRHDGDHITYE